jgi:UDP-N-acetylglucosamine 2-epimerase (non-hydrolysing)
LVGRSEESVYRSLRDLWETPALHAAMSTASSPYGDGYASRRIAEYLTKL